MRGVEASQPLENGGKAWVPEVRSPVLLTDDPEDGDVMIDRTMAKRVTAKGSRQTGGGEYFSRLGALLTWERVPSDPDQHRNVVGEYIPLPNYGDESTYLWSIYRQSIETGRL
ncbi:hypothetical protein [Sphingomonas faeni]|uniref:hypothetical protein n=1 Tax=Sphingomonas faeni TaxID=185950 RepID=UPI00335E0838